MMNMKMKMKKVIVMTNKDENIVIPDGEEVTEATFENLSNNKGDEE